MAHCGLKEDYFSDNRTAWATVNGGELASYVWIERGGNTKTIAVKNKMLPRRKADSCRAV